MLVRKVIKAKMMDKTNNGKFAILEREYTTSKEH